MDLGDVEKLKDMDIQVGNRITAWGRSVDVGDKRACSWSTGCKPTMG